MLGRRLFWDPRGPVELYPQFRASLGSPMRVSWSQDIEDPDEPGRLVNRLEGMALGCAWLLDRWNELGDLLEDGLKWQAPDRFKATRLLGKQPLEPIDDLQVRWIHLCVSAMDPECEGEFGDLITELHTAEWDRFVERLEARDAWRDKPEEAEVARAALLELVSEQEERLETLLAAHLERESAADPDALGFQDTAEGERLRRYQIACNQTLLRILETLRRRHREADRAKEGSKRGRRSSVAASGVESPTEADLLRETFAPVIAQGQEPDARLVGESEPSSEADLLRETCGRVNGRQHFGCPETRAQQSKAVPTLGGLVGRASPDPVPSPTAGLPILENATNEATAPPLVGLSPTAGPPIPENATNEPNSPPRSFPARPTAALTRRRSSVLLGLAAAFATVIGPDPTAAGPLRRAAGRTAMAVGE